MDYIKKINEDYKNVTDLVKKEFKGLTLFYLETLISQDKINDYILKVLAKSHILPKDIKKLIPSPNIKEVKNYKEFLLYLNNGFTIIIHGKQTIAIETKGELTKSIAAPTAEPTLFGPKDALTENFQTNLGLIKRRMKTSDLKNENINIGKYTETLVSILYVETIADKDILENVKEKLNKVVVDGVTDIGELRPTLIEKENFVFPSIKITERPDVITKALLAGKIVLLMDSSPYAMIIPTFLADFINPIADDYSKSINVNFIKFLRFACFFISIMVPAIYVAITTYNQETIPTSLLINFQNQRSKVPFPATIECLITLLTCEVLRESDLRFPSSYGSAISILGALVLGEAAVSAGIVSPIMIIVVSITFISSLIFTDLEIIGAIRHWRFLFLLVASIYGLYGVGISFILFITYITSFETYKKPYFYPLSPFDPTYLKETLVKMKNTKRSKLLSKNRFKGDT